MKRLLAAPMLLGLCTGAWASGFDLNAINKLSQTQFHQLSEDLGAALSYKPLEPAEALGPLGFDIGAVLTGTSLANTDAVQQAVSGGTVFNTLPVPSVRAVKGLPFDVDIGVMYSHIPASSINLYGGELKWAFIPGSVALPAVALRAAVTTVSGVSQLGFETISADLSISKGFLLATPYAGVGTVHSRSAADGTALQQVNLNQGKIFGGVSLNLGLANLDLEADSTGGIRSYSAKVGVRF